MSSRMDRLETVGDWVANRYPGFDPRLSPNPECQEDVERKMMGDFPHLKVQRPGIPYTRYDTAIARLVAAMYADQVKARGLGFTARLTNSGMSAINTVLETVVRPETGIIAGNVLYSLTPGVLRRRQPQSGNLWFANPEDLVEVFSWARKIWMNCANMVFVFESIGNGMGMPVLPLEEIMRELWANKSDTLVVDGTFTTSALLNPFQIYGRLKDELGAPAFNFVYVESLSKYYRAALHVDHAPGGIIVAPDTMFPELDNVLVCGAAMTWPALCGFPMDLYGACSRVMPVLSENAAAAAEFLRKHPRVKQVWYPDSNPLLPNGAGGVLYLEFDMTRGDAGTILQNSGIPFMASFGHEETTHVDFGAHDEALPPGLVRIAVGTRETPQDVVQKLEHAFGPISG